MSCRIANNIAACLAFRRPVALLLTMHDFATLRHNTANSNWSVSEQGYFFYGVTVVASAELHRSVCIMPDAELGVTVRTL